MLTLTIDGKVLIAEEEKSILEIARANGIDIPTLCYHPALEPFGGCRLCTVEIRRGERKRLVTSCNYPVEDGLEVNTASEEVIEARRWILETLLARCPNVEIIQNLAREYGIEKPRFKLEDEKCILCGLCVRMCGEKMGRSAINFVGRGVDRKIDTPFHVQTEDCMACGACISVCPTGAINLEEITKHKPIPIVSEFDQGLSARHPIYVPFPQAIPNVPAIDRDKCAYFLTGECQICRDVCPAQAINYEQEDEVVEIEVGSMILAPGYDCFDPKLKGEYGYGRMKNVVTSMEFERILSASGPYQGEILRPSDGEHPKRIAWLQCVGSRDPSIGYGYCSSVCCMYAIKEMIMAQEHIPGLETTVFYNDIRTFGKGFEEVYLTAQATPGINFVKSIVSTIKELQQSKNLLLTYALDSGEVKEEEFDMVVLSVGMRPSPEIKEMARELGIELDQYGFCQTDVFSPIETSRPGIYISGAFQGPMDIPESVIMASGAASLAGRLLSDSRGTQVTEKVYPQERDVSPERPRVGVFVCHCGTNIARVVDVPQVVEYARTLGHVVHAEDNLFSCSADATRHIADVIKEQNLNRVVVASCTPRTHEPLFQEVLREAGINKYLFEMANIRDQCSWVHMNEPEAATEKSKDLIRMAVAKSILARPLQESSVSVVNKALVIGGGLSGMTAALGLAEQGFEVYLVERERELGGNLKRLYFTLDGREVAPYLKSLVEKVESNPLIQVYKNAEIERVEGVVGNFNTTVTLQDGQGTSTTLNHGVTIVATGGREYQPTEYLYGEHKDVITQMELESRLAGDAADIAQARNIVMIQCVGSRDEERPYCSRVCCGEAVKNALKIRELNSEANIYILYRDIRTYGLHEDRYLEARKQGVNFIRYEPERKPEVMTEDGKLRLIVFDPVLNRRILLRPDILALSAAIIPEPSEELSKMLKVPLTKDGFFLEAHVKLRPVDFATDGVFMCGLAHSPKNIDECISQANAAVSRAVTILSRKELETLGQIAFVNKRLCTGCGICQLVCPFQAVAVDPEERVAVVNAAVCKGCGACVATCICSAINLNGFNNSQIVAMIRAL